MKLQTKFKEKISCAITVAEGLRVDLIDIPGDDSFNSDDSNRNIFCIDNDFNVKWQVSNEGAIYGVDLFVQIKLKENGSIEARRFVNFLKNET